MRFLIRALLFLLVLGGLALGGAWLVAGFQEGPSIDVRSPEKFVGQNTPLEFFVNTPGEPPARVEATLEQDGQQTTLFTLDPRIRREVKQESADRMWVFRQIGKQHGAPLKQGPARTTVEELK